MENRFLTPQFDHKSFAVLHFESTPEWYQENITPPQLATLYDLNTPFPQENRGNDEQMLVFLNTDPHLESETLLNHYQSAALATIAQEEETFVATSWELLIDDAVEFLSQIPTISSFDGFETFSPFIAMSNVIPEPRLYLMMGLLLLPVILIGKQKKTQT